MPGRVSISPQFITLLGCLSPFFTACDTVRNGMTNPQHGATTRAPIKTLLLFEYLSGSRIMSITLINFEGIELKDDDYPGATMVSDYAIGSEFETDMTTLYCFDDFAMDQLRTIRVASDIRQVELDARSVEWQEHGPGEFDNFKYEISYSTVLDSKSKPLLP